MPMSIQRQADQYDLDVPPVEHVARHEIEDLLKPAFRLRPNTNNPREAGAHALDRDTYFNSDTFMGPRQRSEPTLTRAMPFESEDADEAPLVMRKSPGKPGAPRHRAASATFGDVLPPFLVR